VLSYDENQDNQRLLRNGFDQLSNCARIWGIESNSKVQIKLVSKIVMA
jgi:hypothetical protein